MKSTLDRQKTWTKEQTGAHTKLEQKITLLTCELKKMEAMNLKMQEQIKRVMGIDKAYYGNSIDITGKSTNGQVIYKNVPEQEYVDTVKEGNQGIIAKL